jgi:hypothetical protein
MSAPPFPERVLANATKRPSPLTAGSTSAEIPPTSSVAVPASGSSNRSAVPFTVDMNTRLPSAGAHDGDDSTASAEWESACARPLPSPAALNSLVTPATSSAYARRLPSADSAERFRWWSWP